MDVEFKNKLLSLYPSYDKVTGPYQRKDKRFHIVLNNSSFPTKTKGKLRTLSWAKALLEVHIGRILFDDETADHIDENVANNDLINLQILTRRANIQKSMKYNGNWFKCFACNNMIYRAKCKQDVKVGIFCSKSCRAKTFGNQYQGRLAQLVEASGLSSEK